MPESISMDPDLGKFLASLPPTLSPKMILRGLGRPSLPFPFDDPAVHYFYLARNAIYALALEWDLSGGEVIFPAYFEGVELEALLYAGVKVRFYAVRERMRVVVDDVVSQIRAATRAVYLIHYLGFPVPVEELAELCHKRGLLLVEDCAQALFSRLGEKPLGSFGDAGVFSIHKTLPFLRGGALVVRLGRTWRPPRCRRPRLVTTLGLFSYSLSRHFEARSKIGMKLLVEGMRAMGKKVTNAVPTEREWMGDSFLPSQADVGMSRLSHIVIAGQDFPGIVDRRRNNYLQLLGRLRELSRPIFDALPEGVCPFLYAFEVEKKQLVWQKLLERGVDADFWRPAHPALAQGTFPEAEKMRRTVLQLPCHQDLTPEAVDWLADQVCEVLRATN